MKRLFLLIVLLFSPIIIYSQNDLSDSTYKECGVKLGVGYPIASYWTGISTSIGFDYLKSIDNKMDMGVSINLNRLTNSFAYGEWNSVLRNYEYSESSYIGYYGNLYIKYNYYIVNLTELNKSTYGLCKIYLTCGMGIGFDNDGYLKHKYGSCFYEANIGIGVVCHYKKKYVLRVEDKFFLPGTIGNGFHLLNGTFKGYYHLFNIGIYYNL